MFGLEEQSVRRSGPSWPPIAPIAACPAATSPDTDALLVTLQHAAACRRSPRAGGGAVGAPGGHWPGAPGGQVSW